jgi:hypothetical protein
MCNGVHLSIFNIVGPSLEENSLSKYSELEQRIF